MRKVIRIFWKIIPEFVWIPGEFLKTNLIKQIIPEFTWIPGEFFKKLFN